MMAFDHVFMSVARKESRAIHAFNQAGITETYLFREFYCTDPGCDCRRVILHVHWVEGERVAATINYAFEPSRRRDEPQIYLDPLNPQSERSDALLALFTGMIAKDVEYRERLIQHYAMWKQVVDDPSHPQHGKVRGQEHDDPSFRPAFPRKKAPARGRRGKGTGVPAGSQSLERVTAKGAGADSKLQQKFRRLIEKVDGLRQRVRTWKQMRPGIDAEISSYAALFERQCRLGRELIGLLDRSYLDPVFSKADRKKLAELICSIAGDLLEQGGHDDLKPLYNRHSRSDFDAEAAAADAETAEAMRSMIEALGVDLGDVDVSSVDKLKAYAEQQLQELEQEAAAEEERRARRKKSAKQLAAEARREDERRSTGKALQEVYRALVMALHPDHEQDPGERVRKTDVMKEVNVAYEAKDLLRLLELQLELERVEPARAHTVAEGRLQHYNRILEEQARQLAVELDELELPFRMQLEMPPSARLSPAYVMAQIGADAEALKRRISELERDLKAFEDVTRLKASLKTRAQTRQRRNEPERNLFG